MSDEPRGQRPAGAPEMTVKISEEMQRGVYANRMIVAHSAEEFVIDFVADLPPGPQIVARVVTAPAHLHAFAAALAENLQRYEDAYGPVRRASSPQAPPFSA